MRLILPAVIVPTTLRPMLPMFASTLWETALQTLIQSLAVGVKRLQLNIGLIPLLLVQIKISPIW